MPLAMTPLAMTGDDEKWEGEKKRQSSVLGKMKLRRLACVSMGRLGNSKLPKGEGTTHQDYQDTSIPGTSVVKS